MTFESVIQSTLARFATNGRFVLLPGESLNKVLRREKVPNARGVYLCFEGDDIEHPLYIGKSGTIRVDGSWGKQGITERLYENGPRDQKRLFRELPAKECLAGLTFIWFVTHDQNIKIIPALVEMELLQAHYDLRGCLPRLNKHV